MGAEHQAQDHQAQDHQKKPYPLPEEFKQLLYEAKTRLFQDMRSKLKRFCHRTSI